MSDVHKNPFANYRPPELSEIFSESGKLAIVAFKVERLAERVKGELLQDDGVEQFLDGTEFNTEYDCTGLENFIVFPGPDHEIDFVTSSVTAGLTAALKAKNVRVSGVIGIGGQFREETPRLAAVTARFFDDVK